MGRNKVREINVGQSKLLDTQHFGSGFDIYFACAEKRYM